MCTGYSALSEQIMDIKSIDESLNFTEFMTISSIELIATIINIDLGAWLYVEEKRREIVRDDVEPGNCTHNMGSHNIFLFSIDVYAPRPSYALILALEVAFPQQDAPIRVNILIVSLSSFFKLQ